LIIVDASAVLEFLFATPTGAAVGARITDAAEEVAAPCLLDIEVAHVVRRWFLTGAIDEERGAKAVEHLGRLNVRRWPHEPLFPRIWTLRHNLTAYDAAYVSLAESLGAPLLTCDRSLVGVPGIRCPVEMIEWGAGASAT